MSKPLKISEQAAVQMPMKTVASLILLVAAGVFAYTELTARLVSLETSRELMKADLLKASDQKPVDQEQFMLLESLFSDVEKLIENQEQNVTNKVNIEFNKQLLEKALEDIEKLKDKKVTRFIKDYAARNKDVIDMGIKKGFLTKEQAINDLGMKNEYR